MVTPNEAFFCRLFSALDPDFCPISQSRVLVDGTKYSVLHILLSFETLSFLLLLRSSYVLRGSYLESFETRCTLAVVNEAIGTSIG